MYIAAPHLLTPPKAVTTAAMAKSHNKPTASKLGGSAVVAAAALVLLKELRATLRRRLSRKAFAPSLSTSLGRDGGGARGVGGWEAVSLDLRAQLAEQGLDIVAGGLQWQQRQGRRTDSARTIQLSHNLLYPTSSAESSSVDNASSGVKWTLVRAPTT